VLWFILVILPVTGWLFLVIYVIIREMGTGKVPGETPGKILD